MTQSSINAVAVGQDAGRTPQIGRRILILVAWVGTLLLSQLPLVIARNLLGADIPRIALAWLITVALLVVVTSAWRAVAPLRRYFLVMGLIILFAYGIPPLVTQSAPWRLWFGEAPVMVSMLGTRRLLTVETLIVLAVVLRMGLSRKELFLRAGDMNAPLSASAWLEAGERWAGESSGPSWHCCSQAWCSSS